MQSKNIEWPVKPPDYPWVALTAEEILDGWRDRIERVASEESAYLAGLAYIRAIAVIGGAGRGSPYPLSDIDMLTVAEPWHATDPEELVREVERERNTRLAGKRIPNNIEPSEWVILARELEQAVTESEDVFLPRLKHTHWLGIVIKSVGGRTFHDSTGLLPAFLEKCTETFYTDKFIEIWLHKVITYSGELLGRAERLIDNAEYMQASLEILRTTYQQLPAGAYAVWRMIPQSSARSVTRFLTAAQEARDKKAAQLYLAASRLDEPTTWARFATVPAEGKAARDLMWTIRRGAGEDVDEISVTRDILNLSLCKTVIKDSSKGPRPDWTGATNDVTEVKAQYEAARGLLSWLCDQAD